jgi:hypothetical protein
MATDTRANRLTAPDYIYIRLFIVSMFVAEVWMRESD